MPTVGAADESNGRPTMATSNREKRTMPGRAGLGDRRLVHRQEHRGLRGLAGRRWIQRRDVVAASASATPPGDVPGSMRIGDVDEHRRRCRAATGYAHDREWAVQG